MPVRALARLYQKIDGRAGSPLLTGLVPPRLAVVTPFGMRLEAECGDDVGRTHPASLGYADGEGILHTPRAAAFPFLFGGARLRCLS
jgi:hypothetical protein